MATKVGFIGGTRYSSPLNATGEKKFRELKALGELFVIGFSQDLRPRRFTDHAHFYLMPNLPMPFLRYLEMVVLGPLLACWLILRHGVRILVAQSPYEGFAAAMTKKFVGWLGYKVWLVVENHGDFEESVFLQRLVGLPRLYRVLMRAVARFSLRHADFLRAISNSTRQQLERWVPNKSIVQFPTWTNIEVFLQNGAINGDKDSYQSILYAGVLTPLKGVHHLVNSFARVANDFPNVQLVLVGYEENKSYAIELKEQVTGLGLKGRVQFVGAVAQSELAARMRRASVCVLPSFSEGLGRVVVEAMATSTPVIGSRVGGIPEVIQDGVTGFLVPPGDEPALADKIRWVLEHPAETDTMGRNARIFAERFFSTQVYVSGYQQIFEAAQTFLTGDRQHAPSTL